MTEHDDAPRRLSAHFESPFLRHYVRSKVATDPLYRAVEERLRGHPHPLIDVGCGVGLMAFYLREHGFTPAIRGIDHDPKKIAAGQRIAARYRDVTLAVDDAREALPSGHSVLLLDLLHYFTGDVQRTILEHAAEAAGAGGVVIVRDAIDDGSWRYKVTYAQESFSRVIGWLKAERLHFPTLDAVTAPFRARGFAEEITPLWGKTPFNNYLFLFRRASAGTTKP